MEGRILKNLGIKSYVCDISCKCLDGLYVVGIVF